MNIYEITPNEKTKLPNWDYYDAVIVNAKDVDSARKMGRDYWHDGRDCDVDLLGTSLSTEEGVILASFNAG